MLSRSWDKPPTPNFPIHFSCTQWLNTLCLSPLLHRTFSTLHPFRHRDISALLPTQQICSLDPFPEYFGMHQCLLPICSLAWHRSRGQQGGSEGGDWGYPYSYRAVRKLDNGWKVLPHALFVWRGINVWTCYILLRKAAQIEPLTKNIHSWSLWWKLWLCLTSAVKLWTSDEKLNEREMTERWERGERGMRDRWVGEVVVIGATGRE